MAEVDLKVGGHHYRIACETGQEDAVGALAAMIDDEIMAMRSHAGNLGEARQLLYAALTLADRLKEMEAHSGSTLRNSAEDPAPDAGLIDRLAERMEILADTLEKHAPRA